MTLPKIWLAVFDLHFPHHHQPTWNCVLDFLKHNRVSGLILGGDQFNNGSISHWVKGKPLYYEPGAYKHDETGFDKEILRPLEKLLPRNSEKVWLIGNHDDWERQLTEEMPQLLGMVERPITLNLAERGWQVVPNGKAKKIGKLAVIHGDQLAGPGGYTSIYPSKRAVEVYGCSVLAGHTHSPQSFSKVSPVEIEQKHMAWMAPAACDLNPAYLRNRPSAWVNGMVVIEILNGGNFNVYPVIVSGGQCSFGGRVYGRRK